MTEAEWLACTDPRPMLTFLRDKARERKLRLFACACCRRIWHKLWYRGYKSAVELAERFADGKATREELDIASKAAAEAANPGHEEGEDEQAGWACAYAADPSGTACSFLCANAFCNSGSWEERVALVRNRSLSWDTSLSRDASCLLREIFGNPFHPVSHDPVWRTPTVLALTRCIYDERRFKVMPILADAVEEAGCTNTDILAHCRQPGEHVRGCWVIDLLLGEE